MMHRRQHEPAEIDTTHSCHRQIVSTYLSEGFLQNTEKTSPQFRKKLTLVCLVDLLKISTGETNFDYAVTCKSL